MFNFFVYVVDNNEMNEKKFFFSAVFWLRISGRYRKNQEKEQKRKEKIMTYIAQIFNYSKHVESLKAINLNWSKHRTHTKKKKNKHEKKSRKNSISLDAEFYYFACSKYIFFC